MKNKVIEVNNLSKFYRVGEFGTGTISHDLNRWFKTKILGKPDPYLKISQINDRTQIAKKGEIVKALSDINFEVKKGEVLGIIGKNGAGKSTLLKVLSRITAPTTGYVKIKGRVASLLEVGTGFHPEMTGRENIFLNGTIHGMSRQEISKKLDEIVNFAGVAKYLDTPVKRYSSGMTVRLGFAVAAFLEPEILIVDEVLAVGDAEFQKKAVGKMQDVSLNQGRTVLFVSHNMGSVQKLCTRGLILENGTVQEIGDVNKIVSLYLRNSSSEIQSSVDLRNYAKRRGNGQIKAQKIEICNSKGEPCNAFLMGDDLIINLHLKSNRKIDDFRIAVQLYESDGTAIANMIDIDSKFKLSEINGLEIVSLRISNINFYPQIYNIGVYIGNSNFSQIFDHIENCISFNVIQNGALSTRSLNRAAGLLFLTPQWTRIVN